MPTYDLTAELPDLAITWKANDGSIINFSTGYTFTLVLTTRTGSLLLTKTTGITGAATDPNVTVAWAAGEFAALEAGSHLAKLTARHTASGKDRVMTFTLGLST
jgi:hypothetical protein